MISDFRILGIEETEDPALIKAAFRRRAKELHPDTGRVAGAPGSSASESAATEGRPASGDRAALAKHDLFVELCQAYRRLLDGAKSSTAAAAGKGARASQTPSSSGFPSKGGQLLPHRDQAYAFYRRGMAYYMAIHPSSWNMASARMLATRIGRQDEEQESIKRKVLELMELFPKAYYYFGIVVHEYPESQWAADARDKMDTIEERIGRYRRIIESFGAWDRGEEEAARHKDRYEEMRRNQEAVRKEGPKNR